MSSRKRVASPSPNGVAEPTPPSSPLPEGAISIPPDSLVVLRQEGEFGFVVNADSTVPMQAWPTVLRRMAVLLERQLVDGG